MGDACNNTLEEQGVRGEVDPRGNNKDGAAESAGEAWAKCAVGAEGRAEGGAEGGAERTAECVGSGAERAGGVEDRATRGGGVKVWAERACGVEGEAVVAGVGI